MGGADRTYIKMFRRILDWGWYHDTNTFRVFMHILLTANYTPKEYKGQTIGVGECVFGRKAWAEELGLSERQVRTAIEHLKSTNEITVRATNKFSVITVTNWRLWQIEEGGATNALTNEATNERPTTDQQPTTPKESKKVRNKELSSSSTRARGPKSILSMLTDSQSEKIFSTYKDADLLIDAIDEELAQKDKFGEIRDAYRYVHGYAKNVGWPKMKFSWL